MSAARWHFQDALNRALSGYLHGNHFTRRARVLYPLVESARASQRAELCRLRERAQACGVELRGHTPEQCLAEGYVHLARMDAPALTPRPVRIGAWQAERHGAVSDLRRVRSRLLHHVDGTGIRFYLHGSFSTLDFTAYSDLDTLAVLPRETVTSPGALRRTRTAFFRTLRDLHEFDPLQHHGHFVLTDIDLAGYPEPLFPVAILRHCTALAGPAETWEVHAAPCQEMARQRFRTLAESFLRNDPRRVRGNAFRLKSSLSVLMLLPTLWWQARGRPLGKKESFGALYEEVPDDVVDVYRRAANIRSAWRYRERPLGRLARRVWFNPLLPAVLGAIRPGPLAVDVAEMAGNGFFEEARSAVDRLVALEAEHACNPVA